VDALQQGVGAARGAVASQRRHPASFAPPVKHVRSSLCGGSAPASRGVPPPTEAKPKVKPPSSVFAALMGVGEDDADAILAKAEVNSPSPWPLTLALTLSPVPSP
jgi:hypothetical protein